MRFKVVGLLLGTLGITLLGCSHEPQNITTKFSYEKVTKYEPVTYSFDDKFYCTVNYWYSGEIEKSWCVQLTEFYVDKREVSSFYICKNGSYTYYILIASEK